MAPVIAMINFARRYKQSARLSSQDHRLSIRLRDRSPSASGYQSPEEAKQILLVAGEFGLRLDSEDWRDF